MFKETNFILEMIEYIYYTVKKTVGMKYNENKDGF